MNTLASITPAERLLNEYQHHLVQAAGLTPASCRLRLFHARSFLNDQFKPRSEKLDFQKITPQRLLHYVLKQQPRFSLRTLQSLAGSLRSFCRFLCFTGRVSRDLSAAIPRVASHGWDNLPFYLGRREIHRLLASVKGSSPSQKRNYAILLFLSRLGLRVGEVTQLTLEDIDWRDSSLRLVRTKGRRERRLPLPAEVGRALADYLRRARPISSSRRIFLSLLDGHPIGARAIALMTNRAMNRIGIATPRKGPHVLRHSLACHLVQHGSSLKSVADLLGHSSLSTTQVYAKVNLPLLRQVALPWPQEVRQ